jgi:putative membrane protein
VVLLDLLPHLNGGLNAAIAALLVAAGLAIRRGNRQLHPRLMWSAIALGLLFAGSYVAQVALTGHRRFPGDDAVRTLFLVILVSHTLLAVAVVPLVLRAVFLALRERFDEHRRIVRFAYPSWLYVAFTGVVIYWMNHHLRPPT